MHQPQNMQIKIMNTYDKHISINWHGDSSSSSSSPSPLPSPSPSTSPSSGSSRRLFVIIRQSESRTLLKILVQASLLALLFMVLIAGVFCGAKIRRNNNDIALVKVNSIPLFVLEDLANERLWTIDDKTLIIIEEEEEEEEQPPIIIEQLPWGTTIVSPSNTKQQDSIGNETFTFSFTDCYNGGGIESFLDRTLKVGGVMAVQLTTRDPSMTMTMTFKVPLNYKIVYFRKLNNSLTYIAMKKIAVSSSALFQKRRKPLQLLSEEKRAVLRNLEDVLLEPPRSASGKSKTYLRKTKFLPNLLNDSLEGYSRRVYIDVVGGGNAESTSTLWFEQYYPTRNKHFDIYKIETVVVPETNNVDELWEGPPTQMMGISEWLWRNVKEEEFVVMKADAEVVEEMFKKKAITLVDELFLDCKPLGKRGGGSTKRRPYWECLALYGRLRDFGVVVHQWWG